MRQENEGDKVECERINKAKITYNCNLSKMARLQGAVWQYGLIAEKLNRQLAKQLKIASLRWLEMASLSNSCMKLLEIALCVP